MKRIPFAFLFALSLIFAAGLQAQTKKITEPIPYNDFIVGEQDKIGIELITLVNMFGELPEDRKVMDAQLDMVVKQASKSVKAVENLQTMKDDMGLRKAALDLFRFYERIMNEEYRTIIDQLYAEMPDMELMNDVVSRVETEEQQYDAAFQTAQQKLAAKHGFILQENELQEEIDEMGN